MTNRPIKNITLDLYRVDRNVLIALAMCTGTPVDVLKYLAKEDHWELRDEVANNPSTPDYVLESLAFDKDFLVRISVTENPNTPIHVLEELENDGLSLVRFHARATLEERRNKEEINK